MHSPGPWTFDHDWRRLPTIFGADQKTKIAVVEKLHGDQRTPAQEANARLIAAAPELYEALKGLADQIGMGGIGTKARAALAKALPQT